MTKPHITVYTDGGCIGNPGPGGYGVVFKPPADHPERSGGFAHTTNNRMEIYAAIMALKAIKKPSRVTLYSDSKYLVNAVERGWVFRWRANQWKRNKRQKAENIDLWKKLLPLLEKHQVKFKWVKGHANNPLNERADKLANKAAKQPNLPPDPGYRAKDSQKRLF